MKKVRVTLTSSAFHGSIDLGTTGAILSENGTVTLTSPKSAKRRLMCSNGDCLCGGTVFSIDGRGLSPKGFDFGTFEIN